MVVFLLIIFKGTSEGQAGFFRYAIGDYVEEKTTSLANIIQTGHWFDNSFIASNQVVGQGGPATETIDPAVVQENSILAFNPPADDYLDKIGVHRSQVVEYTVQPGDVISFIASDFGVSANSIIWANGLKSADSLKLGQILKIPPVSGVIHTIKKGDTLAVIAKKYGVTEDKIVEFNSLPQGGQLAVGDDIIVPEGKIAPAVGKVGTTITKAFSYLQDLGSYFMIPTAGYNWGRIHGRNGVDMANSCGTAIYSAAAGTVTTADNAGWNGGYGQFVKIVHDNGTETLYAHAKKLLVSVGDTVEKGTQIAIMGTTGRSTGCHLHFEVHGAKNPLAKY